MTVFKALNREVSRLFPPTRHEVFRAGGDSEGDEGDWSIIVHPRGEGDLSKLLQLAGELKVLVRIGGRTPEGKPPLTRGGAVRVDMTGMDRVLDLDEESQLIRVQAGISIAVLNSRLAERRLITGWSMYSAEPHTLGAVLSGVVPLRWGTRYGDAAKAVRAMTVALPCGGILTSAAAPRRATGPDLSTLFLGTHGRLGIIGDVTLRVYPWPEEQRVYTATMSVKELGRLRGFLGQVHAPHLLEVSVDEGGNGMVTASFHGKGAEVEEMSKRLANMVDGGVKELPGVPDGVPPDTSAMTLSWPAFQRFLEAWDRGKSRKAFLVLAMTRHSLRVSGGGSAPRRAAIARLPSCAKKTRGIGVVELIGVKKALDPENLLGDIAI